MNRFLSVVPRAVRTAASIVVVCGALIGMALGAVHGMPSNRVLGIDMLGGTCLGLAIGCFVACWLLCLGYVYADARRRAMPPALWVLVAILVPNLLGFLLYFVLRRPIAAPCARCGRAIAADQRFCSWCGNEIAYPAPGGIAIPPVGPSMGGSAV